MNGSPLADGKTCADCALLADCVGAGNSSRSSTRCSFTPSAFIEAVKPARVSPVVRAFDSMATGAYRSPLDPPPGDPRAAHVVGLDRICTEACPCGTRKAQLARRTGLRLVPTLTVEGG
jgi:hypothetical protein